MWAVIFRWSKPLVQHTFWSSCQYIKHRGGPAQEYISKRYGISGTSYLRCSWILTMEASWIKSTRTQKSSIPTYAPNIQLSARTQDDLVTRMWHNIRDEMNLMDNSKINLKLASNYLYWNSKPLATPTVGFFFWDRNQGPVNNTIVSEPMAEQAERAFARAFLNTLSTQSITYADDYQQPSQHSLKRVPVLPVSLLDMSHKKIVVNHFLPCSLWRSLWPDYRWRTQ